MSKKVPVNNDWRNPQDRFPDQELENEFDEPTKDDVRGHRKHKHNKRDQEKKDREYDSWN